MLQEVRDISGAVHNAHDCERTCLRAINRDACATVEWFETGHSVKGFPEPPWKIYTDMTVMGRNT